MAASVDGFKRGIRQFSGGVEAYQQQLARDGWIGTSLFRG